MKNAEKYTLIVSLNAAIDRIINLPRLELGGVNRATDTIDQAGGKGINVNAIAPGYVRTEATQALQDDPVRNARLLSRIPAGRWGEPADIGGAAVFLSSRASDYCHGTILVVDGGWLAG